MKIYTFVYNIGDNAIIPLLALWQEAWLVAGLDPIVEPASLSVTHPKYGEFLDRFRSGALPTVNPPQYEFTCYARWLAWQQCLSVGREPSYMADFDCFPNDPQHWRAPAHDKDGLVLLSGGTPCLNYAEHPGELDVMIDAFMKYELRDKDKHDGRPHVSDQGICNSMIDDGVLVSRSVTTEFPDTSGLAVHYPTGKRGSSTKEELVKAHHPWRFWESSP